MEDEQQAEADAEHQANATSYVEDDMVDDFDMEDCA